MAEIKKSWQVQFSEKSFPHVQQAFVLPPDQMKEMDPFLLLAEDWFKRGTFPNHPHKGFQTITYVMEGQLEHKDSSGGHGLLMPGDVQYMNAGSGVQHFEEPAANDIVHSLQLWLNLPSSLKDSSPFYQDVHAERVPVQTAGKTSIKVYAGKGGPLKPVVPFTMAEIFMPENETYQHNLEPEHTAFIYMLAGRCLAGDEETPLKKGEAALLTKGEVLKIKAEERSRWLIYSGQPHGEPIVARGPFVMNTEEEIREAFEEYRQGKFGPPVT